MEVRERFEKEEYIDAHSRIEQICECGSFLEWDSVVENKYVFTDEAYINKIGRAEEKTGLKEAVVTGEGRINGLRCAIGVMDTGFLMASMGYVVGEKITRLFERATEKKLPVVMFCCSGGARMQEGIISLMQMEKTVAAVKRHGDKSLLYISVLTDPTMGGVTASFALLADVILAEKRAMIGFAGPRVAKNAFGMEESYQTSEFQEKNGFIDAVIARKDIKDSITFFLRAYSKRNKEKRVEHRWKENCSFATDCSASTRTSWEKLQIARSWKRPTSKDFIDSIFTEFYEIKGDRIGGDDPAIVAGIAKYGGRYVAVIGEQKGKKSIEEAQKRNWGMPSPAGYRKALRVVRQANKFDLPIMCFVDTIGADCSKEAEKNGQSIAIASLLREMSAVRVPVLTIVIGEGNSGGALALGIGNEVWMFENAVYSVLSPEAYASIMWKDAKKADEAAEKLQMCADQLKALGIIDKIIPEPEPLTMDNLCQISDGMRPLISNFLDRYSKMSRLGLVSKRTNRFRKL